MWVSAAIRFGIVARFVTGPPPAYRVAGHREPVV